MSNPSPCPEQRWAPGVSGNRSGRPQTRFIRKLLREKDEAGAPLREQIVRHLIEVATRWNVIVFGRNMEVASGRDSVEAAKLLLSYDVGKPRDMDEPAITLPPGIETAGRPLLDVIADVYRYRLEQGQLTPSELHRLTEIFISIDKTKLQLVLALLGKSASGKSPEEIRRMIDGDTEPAQPVPATPPAEGQG